jgi:hypothetical protein
MIKSTKSIFIDTSIRHMGVTIFNNGIPFICMSIKDHTNDHEVDRCGRLINGISLLIEKHRPSLVVFENPESWTRGMGLNVKHIMKLKLMCGTIVGFCTAKNIKVVGIYPREWKGVKKKSFTNMVVSNSKWKDLPSNEHERDSLHMGLWWFNQYQ